MAFGERLQELRRARGMTQEDFAAQLKVSRQAVSKWESGTADPSTSNLLALAKLYGVTAEELLRERFDRLPFFCYDLSETGEYDIIKDTTTHREVTLC